MKILVVGGGGREHALAWKLSRDSAKPKLFCAPGNAGTAALGKNLDIEVDDVKGLTAWAKKNKPDLTVVGPEAPLCDGIVDAFAKLKLRVFGPSKKAAQMEGSKTFAKDVMVTAGVPTGWSETFTALEPAIEFVREKGTPIVIKADGLAAGKGVTVCDSPEQAEAALQKALNQKAFGEAGASVLVEEFLRGEEASIIGLVDGKNIVLLASSQDHKRARDNDMGPNTGGMGAYSPAPLVTDELWPTIRSEVFERTLKELKKRRIDFKGVLYAGLMIDDGEIKVLEFNVRFGDPEIQCILPRLQSDLVPVLNACIDGTLSEDLLEWSDEACACVVMAAGGYPGKYEKGDEIDGIEDADELDNITVFHAGTALKGEEIVTDGGRVLGVTALGEDLEDAVDRVYEAVDHIHWDNAQFRADIAAKAFARTDD